MPQSLSVVYIHPVFSTKERRPFFESRNFARRCMRTLGPFPKSWIVHRCWFGGVEDHIHMLARFGRTISQAEWVKELKRVSNQWVKEQRSDLRDFEWQAGYAAFSVSQSNLPEVTRYIGNQESIIGR